MKETVYRSFSSHILLDNMYFFVVGKTNFGKIAVISKSGGHEKRWHRIVRDSKFYYYYIKFQWCSPRNNKIETDTLHKKVFKISKL